MAAPNWIIFALWVLNYMYTWRVRLCMQGAKWAYYVRKWSYQVHTWSYCVCTWKRTWRYYVGVMLLRHFSQCPFRGSVHFDLTFFHNLPLKDQRRGYIPGIGGIYTEASLRVINWIGSSKRPILIWTYNIYTKTRPSRNVDNETIVIHQTSWSILICT